jgi:tRNA threonylcarbamoyl adenosine modification protein YeaZ
VLVLVLDTSSAAVTAALATISSGAADGRAPVEVVTVNARGHGELLAPSVQQVLATAGADVTDLDAIVVGTGPGPYTGLRVGLVTAAVMGEALGIPTYGVCSLDGYCSPAESGSVLVVADARRKELYWARYVDGRRVDGPAVARPEDVPRADADEIRGEGGFLYDFGPEPVLRYPASTYIAERARERVLTRAPSEQLTPLYLRRPDAVAPGSPKAVSQ